MSTFTRLHKNITLAASLGPGDVILLIRGGHGFEVLEELNMIEVKQGPYVGEQDKTRFKGIDASEVRYVRESGATPK